jgi:hypothetical protein
MKPDHNTDGALSNTMRDADPCSLAAEAHRRACALASFDFAVFWVPALAACAVHVECDAVPPWFRLGTGQPDDTGAAA